MSSPGGSNTSQQSRIPKLIPRVKGMGIADDRLSNGTFVVPVLGKARSSAQCQSGGSEGSDSGDRVVSNVIVKPTGMDQLGSECLPECFSNQTCETTGGRSFVPAPEVAHSWSGNGDTPVAMMDDDSKSADHSKASSRMTMKPSFCRSHSRSVPLHVKSAMTTLEPSDNGATDKSLPSLMSSPSSKAKDVDVLYASGPIRMDSTNVFSNSSYNMPLQQRQMSYVKSPMYLEMYEQQKRRQRGQGNGSQISFKNGRSSSDDAAAAFSPNEESGSSLMSSMEWDYDQHSIKCEAFTQTASHHQAAAGTQTATHPLTETYMQTATHPLAEVCTQTVTYSQEDSWMQTSSTHSMLRVAEIPSTATLIAAEGSFSKVSLLDEAQPPPEIYMRIEDEDSDGHAIDENYDRSVIIAEEEEATMTEEGSDFYYDDEDEIHQPQAPAPRPSVTEVVSKLIDATVSLERQPSLQKKGKRAKTIFCVDLPMTDSGFDGRPGQNGDGHYVGVTISKSSEKTVSQPASVEDFDQEVELEEMTQDASFEVKENVMKTSSFREVTLRLGSETLANWNTETLTPKVFSDGQSKIEIRPSPVPLDFQGGEVERKESFQCQPSKTRSKCEAMLEKKSSLFLQEDEDSNLTKVFRGSIPILNSTAFVYGYKILCNPPADKMLTITPKLGLIPPQSQVTIGVRSRRSVELTNERFSRNRIAVNIFRSSCAEAQLNKYYDQLSAQHPELIQTQHIDKVVLEGNANDLSGEMIRPSCSFNSMLPSQESISRIHLSNEEAENVCRNNAELNSVKNQIMDSNKELKGVSQHLDQLAGTVHALMFLGMFAFGVMMIVPYLLTKVIVEDLPEEPELTMYENFVGTLYAFYDSFLNHIQQLYD